MSEIHLTCIVSVGCKEFLGSLEDAVELGWKDVKETEPPDEWAYWTHLGICPECAKDNPETTLVDEINDVEFDSLIDPNDPYRDTLKRYEQKDGKLVLVNTVPQPSKLDWFYKK